MRASERFLCSMVVWLGVLLLAAFPGCGDTEADAGDGGEAEGEEEAEGGEGEEFDGEEAEEAEVADRAEDAREAADEGAEGVGCTTDEECDDRNDCTLDDCDGVCRWTNAVDGTECDDGFFCTLPGTCATGHCLGGGGDTCDDGDACTTDACSELSGSCANVRVPLPGAEGPPGDASCANDADDDCDGATDEDDPNCVPCGVDEECDDANDCTADACAESICVNTPLVDGTACEDDLFCTVGSSCLAGACAGGEPRYCTAEVAQCNSGVCNEAEDRCDAEPLPDGLACDDRRYCTVGESCTDGACGDGGPRDCGRLDDECNTGVCDEDLSSCVREPIADGTACEDGLFCTSGETCVRGVCGGGETTDCSALADQCNTAACDEIVDACYAVPVADETPCDDGLHCTEHETCASGLCGGGDPLDCSDLTTQCALGRCGEAEEGCFADPLSPTTPCEDGLYCTVGEHCTAGACGDGDPQPCADADACTVDSCNEAADRCDNVYTPRPGTEGPMGQPNCSDGIDNDCDRATDDEDPDCNRCENDGDCDDHSPCTIDDCVSEVCQYVPAPDTTSCEDGQYCTVDDHCQGGRCAAGGSRDCSGLTDQCNTGLCDEAGDRCYGAPLPDTTPCDDPLYCTVNDHCAGGTCTGGGDRDCSGAADQCNSGACDDEDDRCEPSPLPDTTACEDGQYCTVDDHCAAGTCAAGGDRDCSEFADQCHDGACNEAGDTCYPEAVADGTLCDDANPFTLRDICVGGSCVGSVCGDGFVDADGGEHCDDSNTATESCRTPPAESCVRDCSVRQDTCGDGTPQDGTGGQPDYGEDCDDGDTDSFDECTTSCVENDHDIGAPCRCEGSGCSMGDPTAGTIVNCGSVVVPTGAVLACFRSGTLLGNNLYFPAGFCGVYASRCSGIGCIGLGHGGNIGDYDRFTSCPDGTVLVQQTFREGVLIELRTKTCQLECRTDAECRWNEYDDYWSACGQYTCMDSVSTPGHRVCFDSRSSPP